VNEIKLKIAVVIGTRPELIRLSSVLKKLRKYAKIILIHTGQNYDFELNQIFFGEMGIDQPEYMLNCAGENGAITIGNVIVQSDKVFEIEKPDALLVLGDTNSSLSVIAAKRRKIPIFHMEAGNRCFDMRVPEEINRRIADHTADVNLTYSDIARDYLLREGLPPDLVINTGSPMYEVLHDHLDQINDSAVLRELRIEPNQYFLVSAHREENIDSDKNLESLIAIINGISNKYGLPVIVSTHPRTRKRIDKMDANLSKNVRLLKPLGFISYNKLQMMAKVVLSDSGTISEESSILNFPALNIREAHERPEAMEEGAVMMVGLSYERIIQAISVLEDQPRGIHRSLNLVRAYSVPNVSDKVVRIIYSYTDYINRVIWKKY
jgi:UDP-N-acetylglucosamine 2-epimerase